MMTHDAEGFDIARRLKKAEWAMDIPVILVTGVRRAKHLPFKFEPDEDVLPVRAVLEKPVVPEELLENIERVISGKEI